MNDVEIEFTKQVAACVVNRPIMWSSRSASERAPWTMAGSTALTDGFVFCEQGVSHRPSMVRASLLEAAMCAGVLRYFGCIVKDGRIVRAVRCRATLHRLATRWAEAMEEPDPRWVELFVAPPKSAHVEAATDRNKCPLFTAAQFGWFRMNREQAEADLRREIFDEDT